MPPDSPSGLDPSSTCGLDSSTKTLLWFNSYPFFINFAIAFIYHDENFTPNFGFSVSLDAALETNLRLKILFAPTLFSHIKALTAFSITFHAVPFHFLFFFVSAFLSASRLKRALPTLTLIFYLDYVTVDYLRPCLYYRDTTQHRHRRTSLTGGYDSESGCHLSCRYDSRLLPFQTTC